MKKEYFKDVDFLRFIFMLFIVFLHMVGISARDLHNNVFNVIRENASHMHVCVEFFFIISGFFLILTFKKDLPVFDFIKNKFIRLQPVIIFTIILFLICSFFKLTKFWAMDNIFSIFFLNGIQIVHHHSPFGGLGNVHDSWFVSVLFFVSLFYFYLKKNLKDNAFNFVIVGLSLLALYWQNENILTFFPLGALRGLSSIGIGCILGQIYVCNREKIKNFRINLFQKILITLMEGGILGYLLFGLMFSKKDRLEVPDLIFLFIVLFILFILKRGYISEFLDNNFSAIVGKYAYSIFITHTLLHDIFAKVYFTPEIYVNQAIGGGAYAPIYSSRC